MVVGSECERVIRLLMITLAQHTRAEYALAGLNPIVGRLSVLPAATQAERIRREGVLVRLTSLTEAFVFGQLQQRLERHAPEPRNKFIEKLYADEERKATGTWDAARDAFSKWGPGVMLSAFGPWDDVRATIDARNAVVHGLGQFTKLQRKNSGSLTATKIRLRSLGFVVDEPDNRLITTTLALRNTSDLLRRFLEHLDGQLQANP